MLYVATTAGKRVQSSTILRQSHSIYLSCSFNFVVILQTTEFSTSLCHFSNFISNCFTAFYCSSMKWNDSRMLRICCCCCSPSIPYEEKRERKNQTQRNQIETEIVRLLDENRWCNSMLNSWLFTFSTPLRKVSFLLHHQHLEDEKS